MKSVVVGISGLMAVAYYTFDKNALNKATENMKKHEGKKHKIYIPYEDDEDDEDNEDDENETNTTRMYYVRCVNSGGQNVKLDFCYQMPLLYKFEYTHG